MFRVVASSLVVVLVAFIILLWSMTYICKYHEELLIHPLWHHVIVSLLRYTVLQVEIFAIIWWNHIIIIFNSYFPFTIFHTLLLRQADG